MAGTLATKHSKVRTRKYYLISTVTDECEKYYKIMLKAWNFRHSGIIIHAIILCS